MTSSDFDRDDVIRTTRQSSEPSPRGDRPADAADRGVEMLSALGNSRVQRLLRSAALRRQGDGSGAVDDDVARMIQSKQGTGQALDESARRDLGPALGDSFDDVRVHTDSEADSLNRAVDAEAFTTGRDIFFRGGNYNPGTAEGRKLLAQE
jgi:hypothetical protein